MSTAAVDLRYPLGKFQWVPAASADELRTRREQYIEVIATLPQKLRAAVAGLKERQLDTPYRPEGWTVRQVVHHVPDSHMNAYIRFKLALTEKEPTIKPYAEDAWAQLPDTRKTPIEVSLALTDALHTRWAVLLRSLGEEDWTKAFRHPDIGLVSLDKAVAMYAWHSDHHVAHITSLRKQNAW